MYLCATDVLRVHRGWELSNIFHRTCCLVDLSGERAPNFADPSSLSRYIRVFDDNVQTERERVCEGRKELAKLQLHSVGQA